ncbi:MAG: hypothetical protein LBF22_01470 [Deltaproteobacteria bacterium]|jgi:hypothetical protein|nr:hypothetical protein [Deltaproteobacteria bacterium]
MPILLIVGVLLIIGGLTLFVVWIEHLWDLIKALAPLGIISVGAIITYFGWEEKKDRTGAFLDFSSPSEASRYQAEALAYQEKLNDLQEGSLAEDPTEVTEAIAEAQGDFSSPETPQAPETPQQGSASLDTSNTSDTADSSKSISQDSYELTLESNSPDQDTDQDTTPNPENKES